MLDLAHEMRNQGIVTTLATLRDELVGFSADDFGVARIRIQGSTALGRITSLRSHLQIGRFDLVHTTLLASDITGRLAAWGTGIPVLSSIVNTTYDPDRLSDPHVSAWKVALIRQVDGWTARNLADRLHAISEEVRASTTRALGVSDSRVVVIPRGRDPDQFKPMSPLARDAVRHCLATGTDFHLKPEGASAEDASAEDASAEGASAEGASTEADRDEEILLDAEMWGDDAEEAPGGISKRKTEL